MVYRSRSINWNLLTDPASRGLDVEAAANARLGASIAGAGEVAGLGFRDKRLEAESKRRFDAEMADREKTHAENAAIRREALDLRQREIDLRREARQANDAGLIGEAASLSERSADEIARYGKPTQQTLDAVGAAAGALGPYAVDRFNSMVNTGTDPGFDLRRGAPSIAAGGTTGATATGQGMSLRAGTGANAGLDLRGGGMPGLPEQAVHLQRQAALAEVARGGGPDAMQALAKLDPEAGDRAMDAAGYSNSPNAPLVGPQGYKVTPSWELFRQAGEVKASLDVIEADDKSLLRRSGGLSLRSTESEAAQKLAHENAKNARMVLNGKYKELIGMANVAKEAETKAATQAIAQAEIARKQQDEYRKVVGGMKVHGITPTGDPDVDAETLRLKQAQVAKEQEIAASKAKGEFSQTNKGEDIEAKEAKDLESSGVAWRDEFHTDPDPKMNAADRRAKIAAHRIAGRASESATRVEAQTKKKMAKAELDAARKDLQDPKNRGKYQAGDAGGLGNARRERLAKAQEAYNAAVEDLDSVMGNDGPGVNGAEDGAVAQDEAWMKDPEYVALSEEGKAAFRKKIGK